MTTRENYKGATEIVPGVCIDGESGEVYIFDAQGEICMWNHDEVAEDSDAFVAALVAVALAAKRGAEAVRANIVDKGDTVHDLIHDTNLQINSRPHLEELTK